jgi:hypothetical protein
MKKTKSDVFAALLYCADRDFRDCSDIYDTVARAKEQHPELFSDFVFASQTLRPYSPQVDECISILGVSGIIGYRFAVGEDGVYLTKRGKKYIEDEILHLFKGNEIDKLKECAVN